MNNGKIDLNDLANRHKLSVVPREEPDERQARLGIEKADAEHQRRKELALLVGALVAVGATLSLCVWAIVREGSTAEDTRWAVPLLTAIVTGLVGYVTGRQAK
jgi:hypothetical protein